MRWLASSILASVLSSFRANMRVGVERASARWRTVARPVQRRRLGYANAVSTLALFLSLSGGAMAGVKYLTASDPIPATSDLAGSTYGNPLIAAGKVTSTKLADGAVTSVKFASDAVAPDSLRLNGHAASEFPRIVGRGSISAELQLAAHVCSDFNVGAAPSGADPDTDFVLVNPPAGLFQYSVRGSFRLTPDGPVVIVSVCNPTDFPLTVSGNWGYMIIH